MDIQNERNDLLDSKALFQGTGSSVLLRRSPLREEGLALSLAQTGQKDEWLLGAH
jgi:hypothetical protein